MPWYGSRCAGGASLPARCRGPGLVQLKLAQWTIRSMALVNHVA